MRLFMAALVCTTSLAVTACGRGADETTPAEDAGMRGEVAEDAAPDPGLGEGIGGALTRRDLPEFLEEAALSDMAEIQLGQLAQKRAQNPEVRKFAQRMVAAHQRSFDELKKLAQQANVQLPGALDEDRRERQQRLQDLKGREFDREYMSMMVEAHEDTVDLLEDRAEGRVDTVGTTGTAEHQGEQHAQTWASKTLPTVQEHLEQAKQLRDRVSDEGQ